MASWSDFAAAAPELAAWGEKRFNRSHVAYLATVRKDGGPRIHPVTPVICEDRLLVFIDPDSPKAYDLRRDGRYALHSLVDNPAGAGGEFVVTGRAVPVDDGATCERAFAASYYAPAKHFMVFELDIARAVATEYDEDSAPQHRQWNAEPAATA
jgi:nitroimidazol reductase NimA-like FMN-containing flavoprotein (pyridoxamine 5'-phosphate oxidase superfamily)